MVVGTVYEITDEWPCEWRVYYGSTCDVKKRIGHHKTTKKGVVKFYNFSENFNFKELLSFEIKNEDDLKRLREMEDDFIKTKECVNKRKAIHNKKEYEKEYEKTDKRKEYKKEYEKTDKRKEYKKEYKKEYQKSDKYKEYRKEYEKTDKCKEYRKQYGKEYRKQRIICPICNSELSRGSIYYHNKLKHQLQ